LCECRPPLLIGGFFVRVVMALRRPRRTIAIDGCAIRGGLVFHAAKNKENKLSPVVERKSAAP
jgi:hypothetical protein